MENNSTTETQRLTRAEAAAWIKRAPAGVSFYVHVSMDVAIVDSDTQHYPGGNRTTIDMSRPSMLKLAKTYLTDRGESEGRRIPCSVYRADRGYVAYYIG